MENVLSQFWSVRCGKKTVKQFQREDNKKVSFGYLDILLVNEKGFDVTKPTGLSLISHVRFDAGREYWPVQFPLISSLIL